jgi:hypothetical protein
LELLAERRNLDHAILRLWLEGHGLESHVQSVLRASAARFEGEMKRLAARYDAAIDDPQLMRAIKLPRGTGWIRHRLKKDYPTLIEIVVRAWQGDIVPLRDLKDLEAFRRLLDAVGEHLGWADSIVSMLREDPESMVELASRVLPTFKRSISGVSVGELEEVRGQTVDLARSLGAIENARSQQGIVSLLAFVLIVRSAGFTIEVGAIHEDHPAVQSLLTPAVKDLFTARE